MRWLVFGMLVCGCTAPGSPDAVQAPADSAAGEVGFQFAGPAETAIVVPVHINGSGPYDFVLDTGATMTCVDQTLRNELQLPEDRSRITMGAGIGQSGQVQMVSIDSFRVGSAHVTELPTCVLDLAQFRKLGVDMHGLIGLNFLKEFRVSVDFERQVLGLHKDADESRERD